MPKTVQISAEFIGLQGSLEKQIAAATRGNGLKIPLDTKNIADFNNQLDRATQRVVTLGTAFTVISTANQAIRNLVSSTIEVEKSLTNVNTIFRLTNDNLNKFSGTLFDISRETASSFNDVAKAATEFARQGLSVVETQKAVRAALLLSRDANIDVEESVRAITSATNSFNKEALSRIQVVNRLASVDAAFAVSSKDLSEALIRTGSAAADAGVDFNQFIGLVTAAQQISQRGGTVIAGALNTIFTRVSRKDTLEALDSLGVAITDVRGQALPTIAVLQNFANAYDKMTGSIKNQAAELVGGVRQLNTLKATLKDLGQGDNSVFNQVQQVISRSSNELERRNAERNQTLSSLGSRISTTGQQVGSNIGSNIAKNVSPLINQFVDNPVTRAFEEANGSAESAGGKAAETFLKGFGSAVVFGLAPIILKVLTQVTTQVGSNLLRDVAAITGLNTEEQKRATIEQEIVAIYKAGGVALQEQLATMTSLAERAAYVRTLLGSVSGPGTSARTLAGEVLAQGYTSRRRTPGAAGGYLPIGAESSAIAAGVGGAPSSARPVYLPDFNRPDGRGIVANTSEFVVPGAAGGYPSIYNRSMIQKMGLPPGATPVAAGGYVPNAAGSFTPGSLRTAGGQFADVGGINQLLDKLGNASTRAGAEKVSGEIIAITQTLNQVSQSHVLETIGSELSKFDKGLNAVAIRAKMVTDQSRRAGGPGSLIESRPWSGVPYNDPIGPQLPPGWRERSTTPGSLTYQAYGPYGPNRPSAPPSLYSRASARAGTIGGSLALGLGLPFLGGTIDDGTGGTASGIVRGAAKQGLQGAGTGATIGSFFGPEGALPGAIIGGSIGTLTGAISKASKSFEELSTELDQKTKKLSEELTNVNERFRLRGELKDAMAANNQDRVVEIKKELALQSAKKIAPEYQNILDKYAGDYESGQVEATRFGNANKIIPSSLQSGLLASFSKIGTKFGASEIGQFLGGEYSSDGNVEQTIPKQDQESVANAIGAAIANLSPKQQTNLRSLAKSNLPQAIGYVAKGVGVDSQNILDIQNKTSNDVTFRKSIQSALLTALDDINLKETAPVKEINETITRERDLLKKAADLRRIAAFSEIAGTATQSITNTRNRIALNNPALTDIQKLTLEGQQGVDNVRTQFAQKSFEELNNGKANLISIASKAGNQNVYPEIDKIDSAQKLTDFRRKLFDDAGNPVSADKQQFPKLADPANGFGKALIDLEEQLKLNVSAQKQNIASTNKITQLNIEDVKNRGTLTYAQGEDTGQIEGIEKKIREAGVRRDSADVTVPLGIQLRQAKLRQEFRAGMSQERLDANLFVGGLSDDLNATRRQNRALSVPGVEDKRIGFGLDQYNANLDRRIIDNSVDLGVARNQGDDTKVAQLTLEQNALLTERARILGTISDRQQKVIDGIDAENKAFKDQIRDTEILLQIAQERHDEEASISALDLKLSNLNAENAFRNGNISEGQLRLSRLGNTLDIDQRSKFTNGAQVSADTVAIAQEKGLQGDAKGSFLGGFNSTFAGAKKDIKQFAEVGKQVADSFQNNFANAFGNFVTGARKAKDAFRDFVLGVLQESARAFATKAVVSLLGALFGSYTGGAGAGASSGASAGSSGFNVGQSSTPFSGNALGGPIGRASGGMIPTMLTGGEVVIPPAQASRIGGRMLKAINSGTMRGFAPGGLVHGGSGVKDDVFQLLKPDSYVIRKPMVERYGADNITSLAIGGAPDANSPLASMMNLAIGGFAESSMASSTRMADYANTTAIAPTSLHMADGGPVASMMDTPTPTTVVSGGGGGTFNIGVTINDNSTTSQSSTQQGNGGGLNDKQFGDTLARRIKQLTLQTIEEQTRSGGILRVQGLRSST